MPGMVSEDMPGATTPDASLPFGQGTDAARMLKSTQSNSGVGAPKGGPPPQAPQQPEAPPPPAPVQPEPRLDMNQVFPPMPELQQQIPWRQQLRQQAQVWAAHPQAGPAWQRMADLISKQHGPMY